MYYFFVLWLIKFYIKCFKNLSDVEFDLCNVNFGILLFGKNGIGKINVLSVIIFLLNNKKDINNKV